MTLYLLFEQLEGQLPSHSRHSGLRHAAAQAPQLGSAPRLDHRGRRAKAIVTKSANDIAVAVAGPSAAPEDFAEMMTRRRAPSRHVGTNYANASGLPNEDQITTARDLSPTLGRAIQDRFPEIPLFLDPRVRLWLAAPCIITTTCSGRVEGMDGIKTGYTKAWLQSPDLRAPRRLSHRRRRARRPHRPRPRSPHGLLIENIDDGATRARRHFEIRTRTPRRSGDEPVRSRSKRRRSRRTVRVAAGRVEAPCRAARSNSPGPVGNAPSRAPVPPAPKRPVPAFRRPDPRHRPRRASAPGLCRRRPPRRSRTPRIERRRPAPPPRRRRRLPRRAAPWRSPPHDAVQPALGQGAPRRHPAEGRSGPPAKGRPSRRSRSWRAEEGRGRGPRNPRPSAGLDHPDRRHRRRSRSTNFSPRQGKSRAVTPPRPSPRRSEGPDETLYRARFAGLRENAAESACRELKRSASCSR